MEALVEESQRKIRIRPRFHIHVPLSVEEVSDKLNNALAQEKAPCHGKITHGFGTLRIPHADQHYWSPQLTISMEEDEDMDGMTSIRGMYGPRSAVWTMFIFFYSVIGVAILIISIIGFSNRSLGEPSGILWLVPILIVLFMSLYLAAFFGQKLGHDQMVTLHNFIEDATGFTFQEKL